MKMMSTEMKMYIDMVYTTDRLNPTVRKPLEVTVLLSLFYDYS